MGIRLISAAVGVAIALVILFLHNTVALNIAIAAVIVLMLFELFRAGKCLKLRLTCAPAYLYGAIIPFIVSGKASKYKLAVTVVFVLFWFITFIAQHNTMKYQKFFYITACTLLVSNSMSCLIVLNDMDSVHGLMYLVMGLCGAWLADSGAYFAGTFFGRHKLCSEVSPKKTVEGFAGGIAVTGLLFVLINFVYSKILPHVTEYTVSVNYLEVFFLGAALAVVGTIGDLSASVLKRQCEIKDYGNIMPGHGGAMDRFDSVLFVAPCFLAFVSLISIYE